MTTRQTTRRAVLAGSAVALATASIPNASASNADADLLALNRKFDPILREWSKRQHRGAAEYAAFEARVFEATGVEIIGRFDFLELRETMLRPEYDAYMATRKSTRIKEDDELSDREYNSIYSRISPIVDAIHATPARTLAGLAVKAKAAAFDNADLWLDGDRERRGLTKILEAVCALASVSLPDGLFANDAIAARGVS